MSVTYGNAPLIEIVAELRWAQGASPMIGAGSSGPVLMLPFGQPSSEQFLASFSNEVAADGFIRSERLVPMGMQAAPGQPSVRFRRDGSGSPSMLQAGPSFFSANSVPPYESWKAFSPEVGRGVKALLRSRPDSERDLAFNGLNLRYINAFGPSHLDGRPIPAFIRDVLGFEAGFPPAMAGRIQRDSVPDAFLQFSIAIDESTRLQGSVGQAVVNGTLSALLDLTAVHIGEVAPKEDEVMRVFDRARDLIHETFVEMTRPIHPLMKPIGSST